VGAIKSMLRSVGVQTCLVTEGDTYVCGFLARKMVLVWVEEVKAKGKVEAIDWGEVSRDLLKEACADESGYLESFGAESTAEEISNTMFSRPDFGIFVSMYCCLFKEACETWPRKVPDILAFVRDGSFRLKADALCAQYGGVTPCPFLVCEALLGPKTGTPNANSPSKSGSKTGSSKAKASSKSGSK
jgi:hypothetical protein